MRGKSDRFDPWEVDGSHGAAARHGYLVGLEAALFRCRQQMGLKARG